MITLIIGPMMSGKTTELLRRLERFYLSGKSVVLLRPANDTRGFLSRAVRDVSWLDERFVSDIMEENLGEVDVIGIDEIQFHKNTVDFCKKQSFLLGRNIIMAGLSATSECEMFDEVVQILPYSDNIIKLNAVCTSCGSDNASYTYYLGKNKKEKVVVGSNNYTALCGGCYDNRIRCDKHNL